MAHQQNESYYFFIQYNLKKDVVTIDGSNRTEQLREQIVAIHFQKIVGGFNF